MARRPKFQLVFSPDVLAHINSIDRKYHGALQKLMEERLSHDPDTETRNRKPLRRPAPFGASWELRCGPQNSFRVFYKIDLEENMVGVVAIGVKEGSKLFFGGEEFKP
jgi:mRNA-degrading endonuclease RelE of RelBE toxin-antitoxin system